MAHCRKQGNASGFYGDIAVIQHNKSNGATCFYQALGTLPGQNVPAPISGESAPWNDGTGHWIGPQGTEGIACTACHDNGAFIRSPYLAQLKTAPHALPNSASGYNNLNTPLKYVGRDFKTNRSWSISTSVAAGDNCTSCTACHRLAVSNHEDVASGGDSGTALAFSNTATASSQSSKNPHSNASPIWMRPGQITYKAAAEASASKIRDCARGFRDSGFVSAPAGCTATLLGDTWKSPTDADGDDIENNVDNCKFTANSRQEDSDEDKVGDACDNCVGKANSNQLNTDGDAEGDACDADDDNDNCLDGVDDKPKDDSSTIGSRIAANCSPPKRAVFGWDGADTDNDGKLNCSDNDDDNDSIPDTQDSCPIHHTNQGNLICSMYPPTSCPLSRFWDVCQLGGCNQFLLKLVAAVNPDPTIAIFQKFTVRGRNVYVQPSAAQSIDEIANAIAAKSKTARARSSAMRHARPGRTQHHALGTTVHARSSAMRLEIWSKNRKGKPTKFVALVAEFSPLNTRQLKSAGNASLKLSATPGRPGISIQRAFLPTGKVVAPPLQPARAPRSR